MIIGAKIVMISSKPRVCSFNRWAIFEPFSNLEKADVRTVVPPHYDCSKEFWGNISGQFGTEDIAVSNNPRNLESMQNAIS